MRGFESHLRSFFSLEKNLMFVALLCLVGLKFTCEMDHPYIIDLKSNNRDYNIIIII